MRIDVRHCPSTLDTLCPGSIQKALPEELSPPTGGAPRLGSLGRLANAFAWRTTSASRAASSSVNATLPPNTSPRSIGVSVAAS